MIKFMPENNYNLDDDGGASDLEANLVNEGLTIVKTNRGLKQNTSVNDNAIDKEFDKLYNKFMADLAPQQKKLVKLVTQGYSLKKAAKAMNIDYRTAKHYWTHIRAKFT